MAGNSVTRWRQTHIIVSYCFRVCAEFLVSFQALLTAKDPPLIPKKVALSTSRIKQAVGMAVLVAKGGNARRTRGTMRDVVERGCCLHFQRISDFNQELPSLPLTWHLKGDPSKRSLIFQVPSHRCHVSWLEGKSSAFVASCVVAHVVLCLLPRHQVCPFSGCLGTADVGIQSFQVLA